MKDEPITAEVLQQRATLAGVKIDEDKLQDIAYSMEQSLSALRQLDLRAMRLIEPAIGFRAAWSE